MIKRNEMNEISITICGYVYLFIVNTCPKLLNNITITENVAVFI